MTILAMAFSKHQTAQKTQRSTGNAVAICWDDACFHYLIAKRTRDGLKIVAATSALWPSVFSPQELASTLNAELKRLRIRTFDLIAGVARSQVDSFSLRLPPADDDELPNLVRNEVARQFSELTAGDVVDFLADEFVEGRPRCVEAVVIRRATLDEIHEVGTAVGSSPARIGLRPLSIASLFTRIEGTPAHDCLIVNRLDQSVDLLVVSDKKLTFNRAVRIDTTVPDESCVKRLATELDRTASVAPSAVTSRSDGPNAVDREIEAVYFFGDPTGSDALIDAMREEISHPVVVLDPFSGIESEIAATNPSCPYAALTGMLRDFHDQTELVDFANPKQVAVTPKWWKKVAFYSTAAAAVLAILFWHFTSDMRELQDQNAALQTKIDEGNELLTKLKSKTIVVDALTAWQTQQINWLDEFRDVSDRFPKSGDAVVDRISFTPSTNAGTISMSVRVREPAIVDAMEIALRDSYRRVNSKRITQPNDQTPFPCQCETLITVGRRPKEDYAKRIHSESKPKLGSRSTSGGVAR